MASHTNNELLKRNTTVLVHRNGQETHFQCTWTVDNNTSIRAMGDGSSEIVGDKYLDIKICGTYYLNHIILTIVTLPGQNEINHCINQHHDH